MCLLQAGYGFGNAVLPSPIPGEFGPAFLTSSNCIHPCASHPVRPPKLEQAAGDVSALLADAG